MGQGFLGRISSIFHIYSVMLSIFGHTYSSTIITTSRDSALLYYQHCYILTNAYQYQHIHLCKCDVINKVLNNGITGLEKGDKLSSGVSREHRLYTAFGNLSKSHIQKEKRGIILVWFLFLNSMKNK